MTQQAAVSVKATRIFSVFLNNRARIEHRVTITSDDEEAGDFEQTSKNRGAIYHERKTVNDLLEDITYTFLKSVNEIGFRCDDTVYLPHRIECIEIADHIVRT